MPGVTAPIVPGRPAVWEGLAFFFAISSLLSFSSFFQDMVSCRSESGSNPTRGIVIAVVTIPEKCGHKTDSVELRFGGDGRQYILGSKSSISFFSID